MEVLWRDGDVGTHLDASESATDDQDGARVAQRLRHLLDEPAATRFDATVGSLPVISHRAELASGGEDDVVAWI